MQTYSNHPQYQPHPVAPPPQAVVTPGKNTVATIMKVIAVIEFVMGMVLGVLVMENMYGDGAVVAFFAYTLVGFISGMFSWAVAEIITLLQRLNDRRG